MRYLNMDKNKISAYPPNKKNISEFILGAEEKPIDNTDQLLSHRYPWEGEHIRKDVQKVFTAKLPEEYVLKIKYISEQTNKSQQKIVREILCAEVDNLLRQIITK